MLEKRGKIRQQELGYPLGNSVTHMCMSMHKGMYSALRESITHTCAHTRTETHRPRNSQQVLPLE